MKKTLIIFSWLIALQLTAASTAKNYLSDDYYGLELGSDSWWMQHSDYWQFSNTVKFEGNNALKFTCSNVSAVSETLKAHAGDAAYAGSFVNAEAGTYTLKMKVWIDPNYTGLGFNCIVKEGWISNTFLFSELEKGAWVELSKEITLTDNVVNSKILFTVGTTQVGTGDFYIDNIQLLEDIAVNTTIPYTASITTIEDSRLSLAQNYYDMTMMVYVEENTTIEYFYTIIESPYTALKWDISNIANDSWVKLEQSFNLEESVNNSAFEIKVPTNPEYGGGKGSFYVDDIAFIESEASDIITTPNTTLKQNFKLYPNPSNSYINIETKVGNHISIHNILGGLELQHHVVNTTSQLLVSELSTGLYIIKVTSATGSAQKSLIIKQ